jgi:uncharacterized protein YerC
MTNVSKQPVSKDVYKEIWKQLSEVVGRLSATQASPFLTDLLTESEQIMLAKRLAAIVLIHEEHSGYAISKILKMSWSTVDKLEEGYNNHQYDKVIHGIKKNKADYLEFIDTLVDLIHIGLPRYAGPNRWKFLSQ